MAMDFNQFVNIIFVNGFAWTMPYDHVQRLRSRHDAASWVRFRDGLMDRWSSLNIVTGLIMGAVSTIVCSSLPLSGFAFALGIVSLLGSLISIGFGTGLIYVLGDCRGETLQEISERYSLLFPYALAVPQVWAAVSFCVFFAEVVAIAWGQSGAGWLVKTGVVLAAALTAIHLAGFAVLHLSYHPAPTDPGLEEKESGPAIPMPELLQGSGSQLTDEPALVASPLSFDSTEHQVGGGFGFVGGFGARRNLRGRSDT